MNATAVAEPTIDEQALVAQKGNTVLFLSRRSELRLVRVPRYPILAPGSGRQAGQEPGECVNFSNGQFVCPRHGKVALEDGRKVDAAELLTWLEEHERNGDVNGGFWRVDPTAPAPTIDELNALVEAAQDSNEERLRTILEQERAGWQREEILRVAEGSLERAIKFNELVAREQALVEREQALAAAETPAEPAAPAEPETPAADAPPILSELAGQLHEAGAAEPEADTTDAGSEPVEEPEA